MDIIEWLIGIKFLDQIFLQNMILGFDFWWFDPDKARNIGKVSPTNIEKKKDNSPYYLLLFFLLFILWRMRRKTS